MQQPGWGAQARRSLRQPLLSHCFTPKVEATEDKKDFVHICNDKYTEYDQKMKNDKGFQEQETRIKTICNQEDLEIRKIQGFVKNGK